MTIAIRKVIVPREHQRIFGGQSVQAEIEVISGDIAPILTDPTDTPLYSLFNPSGTALLTDVTMTKISTGRYKRVYQTLSNSAVGAYTANFTVTHMGEAARLEKIVIFNILRLTTFAQFTYLRIADQNGVIWYWYISADNTLASSSSIPSILGKQAIEIVLAQVPRWLQLNNPTPAVRYVYPEVNGDPTVSATQPPVGSGNVGSPTFAGVSGGNFVISLNVSDTIIIQTI